MTGYLLAAVALFGVFVFLQQSGLKTYVKIQKNISSKALDFLNQNRKKSFWEFLSLASILVCLLGSFFHEWLSLGGVILGFFSLWELSKIYKTAANPFHLLTGYEKEADKSIVNTDAATLCDWIDAVHEISYKALKGSSTPLVSAALESELQIGRQFLSHSNTLDLPKIGYVMNFLFERLKVLFDLALKDKQETACVQINKTFGKLALHAMSTHPHFAGDALTFAGNLAEKAVHEGLRDVGIKTGLMLIELTHSISNEAPLDDNDLRDAMLEVVKNLERISKELYRQDKSIPLDVVRAPFLQLKTVLSSSKNSNHPTVVLTINDVDRVLAEYQELELILNTIPPIPTA